MKKSICFASKTKNIEIAGIFVNTICEYEETGEEHFSRIIIAVTESVNNAIIHGNKTNAEKEVKLHYFLNNKELGFIVEDQGGGFNHENVLGPTQPGNIEKLIGKGVFVMKNLADEIGFSNEGRVKQSSTYK
jgi:serine/threonine-protein kinase RsbW